MPTISPIRLISLPLIWWGWKFCSGNLSSHLLELLFTVMLMSPGILPSVLLHFSLDKIFEEANTTGQTATDSRTSSLLMKESSSWLVGIPSALAAEYAYCPESFSLPLGDTLISVCLNGLGQRAAMIFLPFSWAAGGGKPRRGGLRGESFVIDSQRPDGRGISSRWPVAFTACVSPANVREWLDGWDCDT